MGSPTGPGPGLACWNDTYSQLYHARQLANVWGGPPAMHRFCGLTRRLLRLVGRVVLPFCRSFTGPQRELNSSLLRVVESLSERMRALERHAGLPADELTFRPGTMDLEIWHHVTTLNEYRLPAAFGAEDVVIDVGGHIGSFSHAVLSRGAGYVHVCEANPANFELLGKHLRRFAARASLHPIAVWRSDRAGDPLYVCRDERAPGYLTGGCSVLYFGGEAVPSKPFDDLLLEATAGGKRRVRLVKMDCEGSEWPILFTSRRLDLVDAFCGEYHELAEIPPVARVEGFPRYSAEALSHFLAAQGFTVRLEVVIPGVMGHFWAERLGAGQLVFPALLPAGKQAA